MADSVSGRLNWATFRPLFWFLALLYLAHRLLVWTHLPRLEWIKFYLDDFLCLPLILTVTLFVMRAVYGAHIRFTLFHVAFAVLYVVLTFEVLLPQFMPRYTADVVDVGLYVAGGLVFYRFLNK